MLQEGNFYELEQNGNWEAFLNSLKINVLYLRKINPENVYIHFDFPQTLPQH